MALKTSYGSQKSSTIPRENAKHALAWTGTFTYLSWDVITESAPNAVPSLTEYALTLKQRLARTRQHGVTQGRWKGNRRETKMSEYPANLFELVTQFGYTIFAGRKSEN